ncbi:bZIP transcription factor 1 [Phytophthora citrophthora]|uniref:BZIP transcription factor 1 n=1 Tax=Phytophthora citrophthora TaxID=4793 RepID=A0AAD9G960_9STRA|nr:bZIP transcription factor 1 [Phytophthora citrophthora]
MSLDYFDQVHTNLSDRVIGHVAPHRRDTHLHTARGYGGLPTLSRFQANQVSSSRSSKTTPASPTSLRASLKRLQDDAKKVEIKKAKRREQCRTNQARYRDRQRAHQRKMQHHIQQLHEEVQSLKLKRQRLRFGPRANRSPWSIVSNVFRLIETSFRSPWQVTNADEMVQNAEARPILAMLQESFAHDVGMGDLNGMDALLEQVRRYALYFCDPKVHLKLVEELVPGVLTATAQFTATVSEFTLRCIFPHLQTPRPGDDIEDEIRALREKMLGQSLHCSCKMTFMIDEETGRVARLEASFDWMSPLIRLLGNVDDVSSMLNQALITRDCVIGALDEQ